MIQIRIWSKYQIIKQMRREKNEQNKNHFDNLDEWRNKTITSTSQVRHINDTDGNWKTRTPLVNKNLSIIQSMRLKISQLKIVLRRFFIRVCTSSIWEYIIKLHRNCLQHSRFDSNSRQRISCKIVIRLVEATSACYDWSSAFRPFR